MSQPALQRRPYLMADWPKSDGRTFLAHAFAFFCLLEWGSTFDQIDAALDPSAECDRHVRAQILGAVQNFGRVIQQRRIDTYARPFGGGSPRPLPQDIWELDDFSWRFGASAINPTDPFNKDASLTHWIFVDTDQFDEILGLTCGGHQRPSPPKASAQAGILPEDRIELGARMIGEDRYLRKAEVLKLVPMSRSTFDDRVRRGLFPKSVDLGGGIVVWWESEVRDWMREKAGRTHS